MLAAARHRAAATLAAGTVVALTACTSEAAPTAATPAGAALASSAPPVPTGPSAPSETAPPATPTPTPRATPTVAPGPELPRGGRTLFPRYRLVGYSGAPYAEALGRLGIGDLDDRAREIERRLRPYAADGRDLQPVLELIATVADPVPGDDGKYRHLQPSEVVDEYLTAARRVRGLLLLNIQPGRSDFLTEVRKYDRWLRQPDVGLALDPEWAVGPGQVPGQVYGRTNGRELDAVGHYVEGIVARHRLPEKPIVFHQVARSVVRPFAGLRPRPGVVWIRSVDGIGSRAAKELTWRALTKTQPRWVHGGFKLFYSEDREFGPLMTPRQVLALRPLPEYVLYE